MKIIDPNLIKLCQKDNDDAFYALYQAVSKKAFWTAYLLAGNKDIAEDIVQEAFLKCFINIKKLQKPELFQIWFQRILIRSGWQILNKGKKIRLESFENREIELADDTDLWETVETNQINNIIRTEIRNLKPKMRATVILYYYNNLTIKEVAQIMGCLQGTVKSRLHYAKKILEKALGRQLGYTSTVKKLQEGAHCP